MDRRENPEWKGWWSNNPPYHAPVFVLSHKQRASVEMEGGTIFHFVTDGIESALKKAKEAASGRDVKIMGGANTLDTKFLNKAGLSKTNRHFHPGNTCMHGRAHLSSPPADKACPICKFARDQTSSPLRFRPNFPLDNRCQNPSIAGSVHHWIQHTPKSHSTCAGRGLRLSEAEGFGMVAHRLLKKCGLLFSDRKMGTLYIRKTS